MSATGKIVGVNGNMITVAFDGAVAQNEVGYAVLGDKKLMAEIVRVRGRRCDMQVFDATTDLAVDDTVEFSGNLLAAELGPGMLTQVYDGLQNPLADLAVEAGRISPDAAYFLQRGLYLPGLPRDRTWAWHPTAKPGDRVAAGDFLGWVPEGIFDEKTMPGHKIMVPFALRGQYTVETVAPAGDYTVTETIATLKPVANDLHPASATPASIPVQMMQKWPVKVPIKCFTERLAPEETLETTVRTIDTFFPVAVGGTYCIPGPFGAGKTVLQQTTARYAKIDVVISAACGERAGEVVETLKEFPQLTDPRTGKSLMERTVIICNTSSMPVASREASVYTAVTLAEYYRQMGLNVLVLADSTSRWAQAMRELSGRLEEMPADEGFPAYLPNRLASFYERAGRVQTLSGGEGTVSVIGAVSPPGGDFSEPVTQHTTRFIRCFWALDRDLANARHYPAISWRNSYSEYLQETAKWWSRIAMTWSEQREVLMNVLQEETSLQRIAKLVGPDALPESQRLTLYVAEIIKNAFLQQNSFDEIDMYCSPKKQLWMMSLLATFINRSRKLVKDGATLADIRAIPEVDRMNRMKSEIKNDDMAAMSALEERINSALDAIGHRNPGRQQF